VNIALRIPAAEDTKRLLVDAEGNIHAHVAEKGGMFPLGYRASSIEALARQGVKFDPAEQHHRVMIDEALEQYGVKKLTGEEWAVLRRHYRDLRRKRK
jgi:hypothetical protein